LLLKTVNTPENQVDAAKRDCPMLGAKKEVISSHFLKSTLLVFSLQLTSQDNR